MTSLQILYFLTAADCMSFSQTSEKLYVSQPAVSRQIKLLEHELGCQLFDRSRKNSIRLTPAGIVFQDAFSQIQTIYSRAAETVQSLSSHCPIQLKVGVGSGWDMSTALFCVKNQLAQHYPQAELLFESQDFRELRRRIRTGELDVIICTKTSLIDFDGLEVQEIANLESRAYVRKGLLCPEQTPLAASDFQGQTLLMLSQEESPMAMELAMLQFQARQITVMPKYLPNRDSILQALLLGEGVTVFDPYMRFADDPRLTWFNLEDDIPVCVVWSKHNRNPLIRLFADAMEKELGQMAVSCFSQQSLPAD